MTERKFYKTTYVVEILHEEPIPDDWDLKDIMQEASTGSYSADVKSKRTDEVDGVMMAHLLSEQRSDPAFFNLTDEGDNDKEVADG